MNRTKEELLFECITQLKHIDEIHKNEPLATTTCLIREINQVLNLSVVSAVSQRATAVCNNEVNKCPKYMSDKNGEDGCTGCEFYY